MSVLASMLNSPGPGNAPAAAASIGQVHRAIWHDGRKVAVKIQYPGAAKALSNDFTQLSRVGRLFGVLMPGLDVKPMLDELRARVVEELDYRLEATAQQAFADAYAGDRDIWRTYASHDAGMPPRALCLTLLFRPTPGRSCYRAQRSARAQIAFAFGGDIWIVDRAGGDAQRLVTGTGVLSHPIFSPGRNDGGLHGRL